MKQAKIPTNTEMKRLLAVVDTGRHASRNRAMLMLSFYAGLRVGEIAALLYSDVFDAEGRVQEQIVLKAAYTKGNQAGHPQKPIGLP